VGLALLHIRLGNLKPASEIINSLNESLNDHTRLQLEFSLDPNESIHTLDEISAVDMFDISIDHIIESLSSSHSIGEFQVRQYLFYVIMNSL
jgi:hypothetical protein